MMENKNYHLTPIAMEPLFLRRECKAGTIFNDRLNVLFQIIIEHCFLICLFHVELLNLTPTLSKGEGKEMLTNIHYVRLLMFLLKLIYVLKSEIITLKFNVPRETFVIFPLL